MCQSRLVDWRSSSAAIFFLFFFFGGASLYAVVAEQSALHLQRTRPAVRAAGIMISKVHFPKSYRQSHNRVGTKELDWVDFADPARVHGSSRRERHSIRSPSLSVPAAWPPRLGGHLTLAAPPLRPQPEVCLRPIPMEWAHD